MSAKHIYNRLSSSLASRARESASDVDDDERQSFLPNGKEVARPSAPRGSFRRSTLVLTVLNAVFFTVSCFLFGKWYFENYMVLNAKFRRTSSYTPLHDRFRLESTIIRVNGTLWPPKKDPPMARLVNDSHADEQWREWEQQRIVPVTAAEIRAMGGDPATVVKLRDEDWGLGDDAYAAAFDVYHQLHCLNTLRQIAYPDAYPKISHNPERPIWQAHVNHCVDILAQTLRCGDNLNLYTLHWVTDHERPFPNFSINRQCVNFDSLTSWRLENTLDLEKYNAIMRKPEGVTELPAADQFYETLATDLPNPNHLNGANPDDDFII